jgi:hypothetical protein
MLEGDRYGCGLLKPECLVGWMRYWYDVTMPKIGL